MLVWKKLYMVDGVLYGRGWLSRPVPISAGDILKAYFWPGGGVWGWGVLAVKTTIGIFKVNILNRQFPDVLDFLVAKGIHLTDSQKHMLKTALVFNEWRLPHRHVEAIEAALEESSTSRSHF